MNKRVQKLKGEERSLRHSDIQQEPHRVASRLEGAVKNVGIKKKKKKRRR